VEIAKECVKITDLQPEEDHIFVNITSGRKTKAIDYYLLLMRDMKE
jgi:hypothetical protein